MTLAFELTDFDYLIAEAAGALAAAPADRKLSVFQDYALRIYAVAEAEGVAVGLASEMLEELASRHEVVARAGGQDAIQHILSEASHGRRALHAPALMRVIDAATQFDDPPRLVFRATPFAWQPPEEIQPRQWLYGGHYIRRYVTATVAPGGLGKSSSALVEAVAMATGRDLVGVPVRRLMSVWYWNGEDPDDEIRRRIAAICEHFRITKDDIGGRLFVDSGRDKKIIIARKAGDQIKVDVPLVDALTREIIERKIDCLMIDPFLSSHGVPENDNGAIEQVASAYAGIADNANCSVELVHHTRKLQAAGNGERTIDDARGAGALIATARSARILNQMSKEEAERADVKPEHRWLYFRIDNGKRNMQPPPEKADWRKLISIPLGNATDDDPQDLVQVATHWTMPAAFDGVTTAHLDAVIARARSSEYRDSPQSPDWIGYVVAEVVGLDLAKGADRKKISALIRSWLGTKVLKIVEGKDRARRPARFVVPGPGPEDAESLLKS